MTARRVDDRSAEVAHALRRTTFGPFPGQVATTIDRLGGAAAVIEEQLAADPLPFVPTITIDDQTIPFDIDAPGQPDLPDPTVSRRRLAEFNSFRPWWVERMRTDAAGLHEKMTWFWHGHFPAASSKIDDIVLPWRQLRTFHSHALGNFGDLVRAITVDGGMLRYLDGAGSNAADPNENYARELLELFTLGIGQYEQSDVRAAARALAGWNIRSPEQEVVFEPSSALQRRVTFLGRRGRLGVDEIVDTILEQDSCAPFIVTKIWRSFVGGEPPRADLDRLARGFRRSGYEIRPLLEDLLTSEAFARSSMSRARTPVEWYAAATRVTGDTDRDTQYDLHLLGQSPFVPPNVGGWPGDEAWLAPEQVHARLSLLSRFAFGDLDDLGAADDLVDRVVERCSLFELGAATRSALDELDASTRRDPGIDAHQRASLVTTAALMSPEHSLA